MGSAYVTHSYMTVTIDDRWEIPICVHGIVDYDTREITVEEIVLEHGRKHKAFLKATDAYKIPKRISDYIYRYYEQELAESLEGSV